MIRALKRTKKRSDKTGLPPGTLLHIGEEKTRTVRLARIDYSETEFHQQESDAFEACLPMEEASRVRWLNVSGLHDVELIEKIGKNFDFHPLMLEDILNTEQRPKVEEHPNYFFVVLKMLSQNGTKNGITIEQVSIIFGPQFVVSFEEGGNDLFGAIRERIKNNKGIIRKMNSNYLAYALMDAIVDHYFVILEKLEEQIEDLDEELISNPSPQTLYRIHGLKRDLIFLRKSVWPLRELIVELERRESPLIDKTISIYLRDIFDHAVQAIDTIEAFRDIVSNMLDVYLSSISNKMNEVMKVLTVIATVFIPLTFVVGIYGMNFKYMPELEWHWGYPMVVLVMAAAGAGMFLYFRKKKWV